jgi:tetratricopeptide (TPR) repeat protein
LHGRILDVLERASGDRVTVNVENLARHAFQAERWASAVRYARQAAERAVANSAYLDSVSHLDRGLLAAQRLSDDTEAAEHIFELHIAMQNALHPLGLIEKMLHHLQEARRLAERIGDQNQLARVLAHLCYGLHLNARTNESIVAGEQALQISLGLGDTRVAVVAATRLGMSYRQVGRYNDSVRTFRAAIAAVSDEANLDLFGMASLPSVTCRWLAVLSLVRLGEFEAAKDMARESVRLAEQSGHKYTMVLAYAAAAAPHIEQGDGDAAVPWQERSLTIAREQEIRIHVILQSARLGIAYGLTGRHREAINLLEDASAAEESTRFLTNRAKTLTALGYEYLAVRETGRARDAADRALQFTRERSARGDEADALALLGEICLTEAPESVDLAETTLMGSLTIAQEIGLKPLMARLQLCLAHLEIARKNNEGAGRRLSEAAQMCRDLGLQRWLRESEQLAFRLRP